LSERKAPIAGRLSGFVLLTRGGHDISMKETVRLIESDDGPPFTVNVGFVLNHDDRLDLAVFRDEMDPNAIYTGLKILYPELFAHTDRSLT
jgi:hypothetical protein